MKFTTLENGLWILGFLGHVILLTVLLIRKRTRSFPVFSIFIGYQVLETTILFGAFHIRRKYLGHTGYFWSYWTLSVGNYALQLCLILEIARDVLRPTGTWIRDAKRSFVTWSIIGTVVAAGMALELAPPGDKGIELWTERSSVFTSLLICEMFLAVSAAANKLGLPWRSHIMALGQGLTLWAIVALIVDVTHVLTGWRRDLPVLDLSRNLTYLGAVIFWALAFARPAEARTPLSPEMEQYIVALHERVQENLKTLDSAGR